MCSAYIACFCISSHRAHFASYVSRSKKASQLTSDTFWCHRVAKLCSEYKYIHFAHQLPHYNLKERNEKHRLTCLRYNFG